MHNSDAELARVLAWRVGLIDGLGEPMRRLLNRIHPDVDCFQLLLDLVKMSRCPGVVSFGMRLYWRQMSGQSLI